MVEVEAVVVEGGDELEVYLVLYLIAFFHFKSRLVTSRACQSVTANAVVAPDLLL